MERKCGPGNRQYHFPLSILATPLQVYVALSTVATLPVPLLLIRWLLGYVLPVDCGIGLWWLYLGSAQVLTQSVSGYHQSH